MIDERGTRRVGRPPLTDPTALLAAARSIGFAGLTVGTVTTAAGVKYSTFYRHFPSLDALVTALIDQICAELPAPDLDQTWQDGLRATCTAVREMFEAHPGMAAAVISLPQPPAGILALYASVTDSLVHAGFDPATAASAAVCASETVTVTELTTPGLRRALPDLSRRDDTERPSLLAVCGAELIARPGGVWADSKITLLIRGLEAEHARRQQGW